MMLTGDTGKNPSQGDLQSLPGSHRALPRPMHTKAVYFLSGMQMSDSNYAYITLHNTLSYFSCIFFVFKRERKEKRKKENQNQKKTLLEIKVFKSTLFQEVK